MNDDKTQTSKPVVKEDTKTTQAGTTQQEGAIKAAPIAAAAVAAQPAPVVKEVKPVTQDEFFLAFDKFIAKTKTTASPLLLSTIEFMEKYVVEMAANAPTPISGIPGADYQLNFFRVMRTAIDKTPPDEFIKTWNVILSFFWRYREGALGERYVNRFSEFWQRGDTNLQAYQRLINLCFVSANPDERSKAKNRADVSKTMQDGFTPAGVQNMLNYYKT